MRTEWCKLKLAVRIRLQTNLPVQYVSNSQVNTIMLENMVMWKNQQRYITSNKQPCQIQAFSVIGNGLHVYYKASDSIWLYKGENSIWWFWLLKIGSCYWALKQRPANPWGGLLCWDIIACCKIHALSDVEINNVPNFIMHKSIHHVLIFIQKWISNSIII